MLYFLRFWKRYRGILVKKVIFIEKDNTQVMPGHQEKIHATIEIIIGFWYCLAKFKQRVFCLLSSKSKTCKDLWYNSYFLLRMSFVNVFWVLSSDALSCSVRAPCQRTADWSRTDRQYVFHNWTISLLFAPKLRIFLRNTILLLTFFTSSLQFWLHSIASC